VSQIEVYLAPGGDFQQTDNGDLLLAVDDGDDVTATIQRLQRLLTTGARLVGPDGTPISTPGDIFHPDYGASEPELVDQAVTPAFVAQLQARSLNALLRDPTVAQSPIPTVSVTSNGDNTVVVQVDCIAATGQPLSFSLALAF
jgi:phage baseplate assembly protein W